MLRLTQIKVPCSASRLCFSLRVTTLELFPPQILSCVTLEYIFPQTFCLVMTVVLDKLTRISIHSILLHRYLSTLSSMDFEEYRSLNTNKRPTSGMYKRVASIGDSLYSCRSLDSNVLYRLILEKQAIN